MRLLCLAFACLVVMALASTAGAVNRALLIGINSYNDTAFPPLNGCRNDVALMRQVLLSRFDFLPQHIVTLVDAEATHQRILAELDRLRQTVTAADMVYIHYSGHGSTACDLNGDEGRKGLDSSLVTYAARTGPEMTAGAGVCPSSDALAQLNAQAAEAAGVGNLNDVALLNDFDLLDDELERALSALSAVTRNIVFVSDSCHSGTITRGEGASPTRGVTRDARLHPAGFLPPLPAGSPRAWIGIGAAGDTEKAVEYVSDDGKPHGAFTLFWAKALLTSRPQETWQATFNRTRAFMRDAQLTQNPQLEGRADNQLFSHMKGNASLTFVVTYVNGDNAGVNAGSLMGIANGSQFTTITADGKEILLTATAVDTASCTTVVSGGTVVVGSTAVLNNWMPPEFRLKAFVRADSTQEAVALRGMVDALPAVTTVETASEADMVFWLVRPRTDAQDQPLLYEGSLLPLEDPMAAPEVWVLNAGETSMFAGLDRLKVKATPVGLENLAGNLQKLVRMRAVLNMPAPCSGGMPVEVSYLLFTPTNAAHWDTLPADKRVALPNGQYYVLTRILSAEEQDYTLQNGESLIMIQVRNTSSKPYHVYALNITEQADIIPFVPSAEHPVVTEVAPGETRTFRESALIVTDPVETVRVMVTNERVDMVALQQQGITATRAGTASPLERMLGARLFSTVAPTRGTGTTMTLPPEAWGTVKSRFIR